jgi:hypothetical protein
VEAQSLFSKRLEGKVYSTDGDVAAIHVLNITTKKATITNVNGFFSIAAKLNDTLVFSAIQFKRKEIVVSTKILESKLLLVPLEDALTELDEVILRLYNLSGDVGLDLNTLDTESVVTASTLGLPNAYVKPPSQAERKFYEATTGGGIVPLNPILNAISGRTKMLKQRLKRNAKYERTQRVRAFYPDSLFVKDLKIPEEKIPDFMYFCEVDSTFQAIVNTHDQLRIWEYMRKKSRIYRKNNELD